MIPHRTHEVDTKLMAAMTAFSGDSSKYTACIRTFEAVTSDDLNTEDEKVLFLERCTSGRQNETVSPCLDLPQAKAKKEVRRGLPGGTARASWRQVYV